MTPFVSTEARWMSFIDGENFTLRGQDLATKHKVALHGEWYLPDTFLWMPGFGPRNAPRRLQDFGFIAPARRAYYYTSTVGDDEKVKSIREHLHKHGFHPEVFKKPKGHEKSKGVDITLTKDMLSHAFMNNYDGALLVAGDGDYVPLVREVKRLGKTVGVAFFEESGAGLNDELRLSADVFDPIDATFVDRWRGSGR